MPSVGTAIEVWNSESEASVQDGFRTLNYQPVRIFEFTCSADASDIDLYGAIGLPGAGTSHPDAPYCYAESARMQRVSPIFARAYIRYRGRAPVDDPAGDPTSMTAYVESWSDVEIELDVDEDYDGNVIATATGEPVYGIKAMFCDQIATIKRNIPLGSYNPYMAGAYRRCVNSATFLGWPSGTAKMMKLGARNVNNEYYELTGIVQFRIPYRTTAAKAWYSRWRHEGNSCFKNFTFGATVYKKKVPVVDGLDKPLNKKALLDTDGFQIDPNDDTPAVVWKETKLYGTADFHDIFGTTIIY